MASGGSKNRTLREEESWRYCLEQLELPAEVLEDLVGHVKWRVSRDPGGWHSFPISDVPGGHFTFTEEFRDAPVLRVAYKVLSDDVIALAWVERVEDAAPFGFDDFLPS